MDIDLVSLEQALDILGQLLQDRQQHCEIVAIGGGSLLLLGLISRTTKDLDLVALIEEDELVSANPLPHFLLHAIKETGKALELGDDWINTGPASLLEMGLPPGFNSRIQTRFFGGLTLHLASRIDQICFKLYAAVDQGHLSKHFADLKLLNPNAQELLFAKDWCIGHDTSEGFLLELQKAMAALGVIDENS